MPTYGFGVILDVTAQNQRAAMIQVMAGLDGLVTEDVETGRYTLTDVLVDSFDGLGNPMQIPVDVVTVLLVPSGTLDAARNEIYIRRSPGGASSLEMPFTETVQQLDVRVREECMNRGAERVWSPITRTTVVPSPPISLALFTPVP